MASARGSRPLWFASCRTSGGAAHPGLEQPVVHHMRLAPQGIGRCAVFAGIERRIHDGEIEFVVGQPGGGPCLADKRHVGAQHLHPVAEMLVRRMAERRLGESGHIR